MTRPFRTCSVGRVPPAAQRCERDTICLRGFTLGINYPWVRCGWDFGRKPHRYGAGRCNVDWRAVKTKLQGWRTTYRIALVRWFILVDGVNYPVGEDVAGYGRWMKRNGDSWEDLDNPEEDEDVHLMPSRMPQLTDEYLEDFEKLLSACEEAGVKLIPSFLDFGWFAHRRRERNGQTRGGRALFLLEGARNPFLDATLEPLLRVSERHRSAVFAWEVINEPDWVTVGGPTHGEHALWAMTRGLLEPPAHIERVVSGAEMCALIRESVRRIVDVHHFPATVGFAKPDLAWLEPGLASHLSALAAHGKYIHQIHHYPGHLFDDIPDHGATLIRPCMVGEFWSGYSNDVLFPHVPWHDAQEQSDPQHYLYHRLDLIDRLRHFPVALLWSADRGVPGSGLWDESQQRQVRHYMNCLPPP
ncbi:MAG: hypothetical protein HYY17_10185 [Planctomycetes bacterium]|nr:hypothetical protein [Planctomycetota bacterium]